MPLQVSTLARLPRHQSDGVEESYVALFYGLLAPDFAYRTFPRCTHYPSSQQITPFSGWWWRFAPCHTCNPQIHIVLTFKNVLTLVEAWFMVGFRTTSFLVTPNLKIIYASSGSLLSYWRLLSSSPREFSLTRKTWMLENQIFLRPNNLRPGTCDGSIYSTK